MKQLYTEHLYLEQNSARVLHMSAKHKLITYTFHMYLIVCATEKMPGLAPPAAELESESESRVRTRSGVGKSKSESESDSYSKSKSESKSE